MRTVLVDDEEGARGHLGGLLAAHERVTVVAECDHPLTAIDDINRLDPELVFLDIQMPLMDGFEMLPYLTVRPIVIFCTAYDEYALKAFEVNALDYLLKPVTAERLALSLNRARGEWAKLESLNMMDPRPAGLRNIVCHQGRTNRVLWLREIVAFRKDGRYTAVTTELGRQYLTELSLDYLEKKIVHVDFFRINRSVIIRKDQIKAYQVQTHGSGLLELKLAESETVSRSRYQAFKHWFD